MVQTTARKININHNTSRGVYYPSSREEFGNFPYIIRYENFNRVGVRGKSVRGLGRGLKPSMYHFSPVPPQWPGISGKYGITGAATLRWVLVTRDGLFKRSPVMCVTRDSWGCSNIGGLTEILFSLLDKFLSGVFQQKNVLPSSERTISSIYDLLFIYENICYNWFIYYVYQIFKLNRYI